MALATARGDRLRQCQVLNELGALAQATGRIDAAEMAYRQALDLANELADLTMAGGLLGNLGVTAHMQGRLSEARLRYEQALQTNGQVEDRRWAGNVRCNLGVLHHDLGAHAEAAEQLMRAIQDAQAMGQRALAAARCNLALAQEALGHLDAAVTQCEHAVVLAAEMGLRRAEGQYRGYLARMLAKSGRFDEVRPCWQAGDKLLRGIPDELSLAVLWCCASEAMHLCGESDEASQFSCAPNRLRSALESGGKPSRLKLLALVDNERVDGVAIDRNTAFFGPVLNIDLVGKSSSWCLFLILIFKKFTKGIDG